MAGLQHELRDAIRRVPHWAQLPESQQEQLAAGLREATFSAGSLLVPPGQPATAAFQLLAGMCYSVSPAGMSKITVGTWINAEALSPPDSISGSTTASASRIIAQSECRVRVLALDVFRRVVQGFTPAVASEIVALLHGFCHFASLPAAELVQLAEQTTVARFPAGSVIHSSAAPVQDLYVIQEGEALLSDLFASYQRPLGRGDFIGPMRLVPELGTQTLLKAKTNVVCFRTPIHLVLQHVPSSRDPPFGASNDLDFLANDFIKMTQANHCYPGDEGFDHILLPSLALMTGFDDDITRQKVLAKSQLPDPPQQWNASEMTGVLAPPATSVALTTTTASSPAAMTLVPSASIASSSSDNGLDAGSAAAPATATAAAAIEVKEGDTQAKTPSSRSSFALRILRNGVEHVYDRAMPMEQIQALIDDPAVDKASKQRLRKLAKNRRSARSFRLRQKMTVSTLQEKADALAAENAALKQQLARVDAEARKKQLSLEAEIAALRQQVTAMSVKEP